MILNYQTQSQLLDDWCWAAVTSSISLKFDSGSTWTQSALAAALLDNSCGAINQNNAGNAPQVCHQQLGLQSALSRSQNYAWTLERYLTFAEIVDQLNSGYPVCCQIFWQAYNQSHFIAIYGYDGNSVVIGDPDSGACSLDYNTMISNGYRSGSWIRTFGTQPSP